MYIIFHAESPFADSDTDDTLTYTAQYKNSGAAWEDIPTTYWL